MSNKVAVRSVSFNLKDNPSPVDRQVFISRQLDKHIQVSINQPPHEKRDNGLGKGSGSTDEGNNINSKWQIRMPSKSAITINSESSKQSQTQLKGNPKAGGKSHPSEPLGMKTERTSSRSIYEDYNVESKNRLHQKIQLVEQKLKELASSYQAAREEKQAILERKSEYPVKYLKSILKNKIGKT